MSLSTHDPTAGETDDSVRQVEFIRLFRESYDAIRACVVALVMVRVDVDDVMQEVCLTLWSNFDYFEPGTSFRRWACSVARNVARAYWRRERRRRGAGLDDEAIACLATVQAGIGEVLEMRRERLKDCVERLPDSDRKLLWAAYGSNDPLGVVAEQFGRTRTSLYVKLLRLRELLKVCIERRTRGAR